MYTQETIIPDLLENTNEAPKTLRETMDELSESLKQLKEIHDRYLQYLQERKDN